MKNFKRFMAVWTSFWVTVVALFLFQLLGCNGDDPPPPPPDPVEDIVVEADQVVTTSKHFPDDQVAAIVKTTGFYEVWALIEYSGSNQKNESFYVQGFDQVGNEIDPEDPNAGFFLVVQDGGEVGHVEVYCGKFDFHEGANWLSIVHYDEIAEEHPDFVVPPGFSGAESVHCDRFKLVFVDD